MSQVIETPDCKDRHRVENIIFMIFFAIIVLVQLMMPENTEASYKNYSGDRCDYCHSSAITTATNPGLAFYLAINGSEVTAPYTYSANAGDSFELDFYASNIEGIAAGDTQLGFVVKLPDATWAGAGGAKGTNNTPTGANFGAANWNSNWNQASGDAEGWEFPFNGSNLPDPAAASIQTASGTPYNADSGNVFCNDGDPSGGGGDKCDDLDLSLLHGTDFTVSIPAGTTSGDYTITIYGIGHQGTSGNRANVSYNITVTVAGAAPNTAPTFDGTPPTTATEDVEYSYTAASTDAESDPLTWNVLGTDTCGGSFAGNLYTFTPLGPTPSATCNLAIEVCDDAPLCTQQTATITISAVNDAPAITSSAPTTATEDTLYSYTPTVSDADGPGATWSVLGSDTCGGSFAAGTYSFTPAGPIPPANCDVAIQVCDGGTPDQCATEGPVTVTIAAVNDPPAITSSAPTIATEDTLYSYTPTVSDPDGPGTNWTVLGPDTCGGTFAGGTYSFTPSGPSPPASCDLSIQVCDGGTPDECDPETATITITAVNDPPTGTADSYSTPRNTVLNQPAPGVLGNDSDPEGGALTAQNPTGTDVGGSSVTLNADGSFTFTPKNNYTGADGFSYDVCDPSASCVTVRVDITVTAGGNNPPTFDGTPPTTATEDTLYNYTAAATDPESDPLTWSVLGTDTCGGSFTGNVYSFTPSGPTPSASCDLAIQVCDDAPACTQQSATITITAVNDAPAITTSASTTAITGNLYTYDADVSDPDGPGAAWSLLGGHTCGGSIDPATGVFTFTPAAAGSCDLNIQICDGGTPDECDSEGPTTITITDTAVLIGHNYDVNGGVSLDCNTCHALHGSSMVPTAGEVYTACTQCHNSTTFPDAADERLWDVANHTVATESAPATIITVDCGQCHEVHKNALLSDASDLEAGGGVARNLAYIRVNMSKYITGALSNTVFQEKPNHFAEYESTGVGVVLNGVCQSCHTDNKYHNNTDTGTDHKLSAGGPPNTTNCKGCHKHGTGDEATNATGGSFAATGGHSDTDFGWAGGCEDCHGAGAATEAVVSVIHGDNCDLCHTNPTGTQDDTSEGPGPVANGVDGDASLANGSAAAGFDSAIYTCLTCHDVSDPDINAASLGGIHHDNQTDGVVTETQCTTKCHTVTGHEGSHDTTVTATTNCSGCHSGTAGATAAAVLNSSDDKIHDMCTSCHAIASTPGADGQLINPASSPLVSAMPAGGGDCNACHGDYFPSHLVGDHQTEALASVLATTSNCATTCHTANTAATVISVTHRNTCTNCHTNTTTNGSLRAGANGNGTALNHTIDSVSTCATCHPDYNTSFLVGHDTGVGNVHQSTTGTETLVGSATCTTNCHPGATNSYNIANGIHNFSCTNCHTHMQNDGTLKSAVNGDASGHTLDSQSSCIDCHGGAPYNYDTQFETAHDAEDHGGLSATASCASCHSGNIISDVRTHGDGSTGTCTLCHQNTTTDGRLLDGTTGGTAGNAGDATGHFTARGGSSECADCHATRAANFQAHSVKDHSGIGTDAKCISCHFGDKISSPYTHNFACAWCHADVFGTDGSLLDGTENASGPQGTISVGDATGHDITGTSTCVSCHGAYDTNFVTAHQEQDHRNEANDTDMLAGAASCTTNCHDASTLANIINTTHNGTCTNCHTNTTTDGRLRTTTRGDAAAHTTDTQSTCVTCHNSTLANNYEGDFAGAHAVRDHTGVNSTAASEQSGQSNDCNDCHSGPVADVSSADEHNDNCVDCHNNTTTNGSLIAGNTAASYNGTASVGDATVHSPLGTATECIDCHAADYFSNTSQHSTNHQVAIDGDTSGGTPCSNAGCHQGQSENWANILSRHDQSATFADACQVCHDSTRNTNMSGGWASVQDAIVSNVVFGGNSPIVSCLECHSDKSAAHGGHDINDGKIDNSANCTTGSCHGGGTAHPYVIHNVYDAAENPGGTDNCSVCHQNAGGGGALWEPWETNNTNGGTCEDCHFTGGSQTNLLSGHHGFDRTVGDNQRSGRAHNGECINCHMPKVGVQGNPIANRGVIMMPPNLACNWCHLWWPNNVDYIDQATDNGYATSGGFVEIFRLKWDPIANPRQLMPAGDRTPVTTHRVSANTTTPISDYGACFNCHGAVTYTSPTTSNTSTGIVPFHGLGTVLTPTQAWARGTGSNSDFTKHTNNFFAGPQQTTSSAPVKTDPYHPGYAALNWLAGDWDTKNAVPRIVSTGQLGGTKPFGTDNSSHKFIHNSEESIRNRACRNQAIGNSSADIQFNNWGADLGSVGSITVNSGGVEGAATINTTVPLVNLSLPTSIGPQPGCP